MFFSSNTWNITEKHIHFFYLTHLLSACMVFILSNGQLTIYCKMDIYQRKESRMKEQLENTSLHTFKHLLEKI